MEETLFSQKKLKLHNCFAYFNQKINPWRIVFYFFILLLRLLSYSGFKFVVFWYCRPTKTKTWSQRSKTHCLYNQDIKSTKW